MPDVNVLQACIELEHIGLVKADNILNYLEWLVEATYVTPRYDENGAMYFQGWNHRLVGILSSYAKQKQYEEYRTEYYRTIGE